MCSTHSQVQRTVVVDGDMSATAVFSKERFMEALHEEQATVAAVAASSHVPPAPTVGATVSPQPATAPAPMGADADDPADASVTLAQAIESVRSDSQPFNWLLVTPVP